jgi:hypothetical protein
MKLVDRYHCQRFVQELLRCTGVIFAFILLYVLIRLKLKNEPIHASLVSTFILYSFAEILPYICAIALVNSHRQMRLLLEWKLIQHYRHAHFKHAFSAWPILLPLSLFCAIYTLNLKPVVKNHLQGELKNLQSQQEELKTQQGQQAQAQQLSDGWIWNDNNIRWIRQKDNQQLFLAAEHIPGTSNDLHMGTGTIKFSQPSQQISINFHAAQWPIGFREGRSAQHLTELIAAQEWSELCFRFNHPLLIFVLAAIIYAGQQISCRRAILLLGCSLLLYIPCYFIFKKIVWPTPLCFMSFAPLVAGFCPYFFNRKTNLTP